MNVAVEAHVAVRPGIHVEQDVVIHKEDLGAHVVMDIVCSKAQCAQVGIPWRYVKSMNDVSVPLLDDFLK